MEKFHRMALLLKLMDRLRENGSWSGETHIQKSAYFVQEAMGVPLGLDFVLYRHGPFSFDLRETLGEMRGSCLVNVVARPGYGPSLEVSETGKEHEERFPRTIAKYDGQLARVTDWLGKRDVYALERLGTALFVQRENPSASQDEQVARIMELKPHVVPESALSAYQEVAAFLESIAVDK